MTTLPSLMKISLVNMKIHSVEVVKALPVDALDDALDASLAFEAGHVEENITRLAMTADNSAVISNVLYKWGGGQGAIGRTCYKCSHTQQLGYSTEFQGLIQGPG